MLFRRGPAAQTGASAAWSRQSVNRPQFALGFIGHHVGRPERCPSQVHIHCLVHGSSGSQTETPLAVQMPLPAGRSGPGTTPDQNVDGSVVVGVRRMATSRTLEHCLILQLYLLELEVLATGVAALRQPLVAVPPIRPRPGAPGPWPAPAATGATADAGSPAGSAPGQVARPLEGRQAVRVRTLLLVVGAHPVGGPYHGQQGQGTGRYQPCALRTS